MKRNAVATPELSYIGPRDVRPLRLKSAEGYRDLERLGIVYDDHVVHDMMAMDAISPTVYGANLGTPTQFLQAVLPGQVMTVTVARKIDELVGVTTAGSWEDEEVVQAVLEPTGVAQIYGDYTNVPLASYNGGFERRTIIRYEEGFRVGALEEARAGRVNIAAGQAKREAAALALDIARNKVGFYGYVGGSNRTYGFLNDPSLPAYVTVVNPGGGTAWSTKTFLQITADIRSALGALRTQSGDTIDPKTTQLTLALPTNTVDYLTVTSDFGISVQEWLDEAYGNIRVVSAPELNNANGGANVFYLYAENVQDGSTASGRVFQQVVPARLKTLGIVKMAKGYEEDYSNATAGVFVVRPYAVVRRSGI